MGRQIGVNVGELMDGAQVVGLIARWIGGQTDGCKCGWVGGWCTGGWIDR